MEAVIERDQKKILNKSSRKVLIIDDDEDFALSLDQLLTLEGYEVGLVHSADQVVDILKSFQAHVALIDIRLGQSDGLSLISKLQQVNPKIMCVVISAYATIKTTILALRGNAYDYLRKPFHSEELKTTLARCFDRIELLQEQAKAEKERLRLEMQLNRSIEARLMHRATAIAANVDTIEEGLQECIEMICEFTGWPIGHAYVCSDDKNGEIQSPSIRYLSDPEKFSAFVDSIEQTPIRPGAGIVGSIITSRKPLWITELHEYDHISLAKHRETLSLIGVFGFPIIIGDQVIAVAEFFVNEQMQPNESLLGVIGDIGIQMGRVMERSRALEQLRIAKEKAEEANRAKSEFLSNISHELRTPLHAILSFSGFGICKYSSVSPERLLSYFEKINQNGETLLLLINDLLDLAKLESGKMSFKIQRMELHKVVHMVVDEFRSFISKRNHSILYNKPDFDTTTELDFVRICQVVRNLLSNAVKFSPEGKEINVSIHQKTSSFTVSVSDQGIGIDADELKLIFNKFVQSTKTNSGAGGTGLGLAICREIILAHQGRIWAEMNQGGGMIFSFELPISREIIVNKTE